MIGWNTASFKTFAVKSAPYLSLAAPVMLVLAGFSIWFAVSQAEKAIISGRQTMANNVARTQTPVIKPRPLPAPGYAEAIAVLAGANPAVRVSLGRNKDSVLVSVADPNLMPEWFYLLSTVQSYRAGLIWTAERICLKKCEAGDAAFAELKAYTQEVAINDLL